MEKIKKNKIRNGDTKIKFSNQAFRNWKDLAQELYNTSVAIGAGDLEVAKINEPSLKKIASLCVDFENFWSYMAMLGKGSRVSMEMDKK